MRGRTAFGGRDGRRIGDRPGGGATISRTSRIGRRTARAAILQAAEPRATLAVWPLVFGALSFTSCFTAGSLPAFGSLGSSLRRDPRREARSRPPTADRSAADPDILAASIVSNAGTTDHAAGDPSADGRSDEELLVLSREGDRAAFRLLLERHRDDLLRYLVRFLGSRAAADDVFQETFLQVHLAADTFDRDRRFRPWLYAIASNKARDHHRRTKRRAAASIDAPLASAGERSLAELLESAVERPDRPVGDEEMRLAVKRVVDEMPAHYREILLLAYFHRMSYQQIAEGLAIPLGTVKSRLHAAVAHFAASWKLAPEGRPADE